MKDPDSYSNEEAEALWRRMRENAGRADGEVDEEDDEDKQDDDDEGDEEDEATAGGEDDDDDDDDDEFRRELDDDDDDDDEDDDAPNPVDRARASAFQQLFAVKPPVVDPELEDLQMRGELQEIVRDTAKAQALETRRRNAALKAQEGPPDAKAWLSSARMTRAEVGLRLAVHLLKERIVVSDIVLALTGNEMAERKGRHPFPVKEFLARHGFVDVDTEDEQWRGDYMMEGASHALTIREKADDAPMVATLHKGARLLVDLMGGPLDPTRSSTEHTLLRTGIGRALTFDDVWPKDVVAVAMPRSKRFRQLSRQWRDAPRVIQAGLRLVLVDRAGNVEGLRRLKGPSE